MQYVEKFFFIIFSTNILNMQNPKIHLVNGLCGYTNTSSQVVIRDTKQAKQSEIQPGRIAINVYYSIIFHRYSTK